MDLQAEKLELVQAILDIDDTRIINSIKKLLKTAENDWFDNLTDSQKQSVQKGLAQADNGEFISHKDAIAKLGL